MDGPPVVLDNGTCLSKNGYGGEDQPRSVFNTLLGYPKYPNSIYTSYVDEYFIGKNTCKLQDALELNYPIKRGVIEDWEAMEKVWHYTFFKDLRLDPAEHPVLLSERSGNPAPNRERAAEILFETFNIPALYISNQGTLSLYASGRTTGLIVDIGEGKTDIVPIYEGFAVTDAVRSFDIGGWDVTNRLQRLIRKSGYTSLTDLELVRDIKERLCYVALDPNKELEQFEKDPVKIEREYISLEKGLLILGSERFLSPEIFFNPRLSKSLSLPEMIYETVQTCGMRIRQDFFQNIILAGGSTMLPGFEERLHQELTKMVPDGLQIKIHAPPNRKNATWIGGSIYSTLECAQRLYTSQDEYQREGYTSLKHFSWY
ncbi:MAG: actin, cytoplasmic 2 [Promethearchaeota archaeon]